MDSHIPTIDACCSRLRPDVHIKYASHAHLDLLFDIYCRRIQAWWDRVMGDGWCPSQESYFQWPDASKERIVPYKSVIYDFGIWDLFQWFHFRGVLFMLKVDSLLGCFSWLTKGQESNWAHLRNHVSLNPRQPWQLEVVSSLVSRI